MGAFESRTSWRNQDLGLEIAEQFRWELPGAILAPAGSVLAGIEKAFEELEAIAGSLQATQADRRPACKLHEMLDAGIELASAEGIFPAPEGGPAWLRCAGCWPKAPSRRRSELSSAIPPRATSTPRPIRPLPPRCPHRAGQASGSSRRGSRSGGPACLPAPAEYHARNRPGHLGRIEGSSARRIPQAEHVGHRWWSARRDETIRRAARHINRGL